MGLVAAFVCMICGAKSEKFYWVFLQKVGPKYWGGLEMGVNFFRDKDEDDYHFINDHEFGHTFQNTLFGPFDVFISFIPSCVRYWVQTIRYAKHKSNPPYDAAWFEDSATQCGKYAVWYLDRQAEMKRDKKTGKHE